MAAAGVGFMMVQAQAPCRPPTVMTECSRSEIVGMLIDVALRQGARPVSAAAVDWKPEMGPEA